MLELTDYIPIQQAYRTDPWRVLVVCALLNLTAREQVWSIIEDFFDRWPGPSDTEAAGPELEGFLHQLGLGQQRARRLRLMATDYQRADELSRTIIQRMHGCGQYAADSFDIFCRGDYTLRPSDTVLREYADRRRSP